MSKDQKNDQKPEAPALTSMEKAISDAIEKALPVATMAAVSALRPQQQVAVPPAPPKAARCTACRQFQRVCKGKHRQAILFPNNPAVSDLFPGLKLNGVLYDSGPQMRPITVPADWDAENMLSAWTKRELINLKGRKKQRRSAVLSNDPNKSSWLNNAPVSLD